MDSVIESITSDSVTNPADNTGMYYMVIAVVPICLLYNYVIPHLSKAEYDYLRRFMKAEAILTLVVEPLLVLLTFPISYLLSYWPPYSIIPGAYAIIHMVKYSGYISLKKKDLSAAAAGGGFRYEVISKTIGGCYFVVIISLYAFICAFTGPTTFHFLPKSGFLYDFPSQSPPVTDIKIVEKNGEYAPVDFHRGYLTYTLYDLAPNCLFFLVMIYLCHVFYAAAMRCLMFYVHFSLDSITKMYKWLVSK